jgi:hypothetical protein
MQASTSFHLGEEKNKNVSEERVCISSLSRTAGHNHLNYNNNLQTI